MSVPAYALRAVAKSFGNDFRLWIDRLDIVESEVLCLLGPTGSGKTTLLRLLTSLEQATSGQITLRSKIVPLSGLSLSEQRRVGYVPQRPHLLNDTVRANVEYGLSLRRGAGDHVKTNGALETLGLARLADQPGRTLSGGQTQLVALARALVYEPDILLLDEPTSSLDPAHVALVERVVGDYHRSHNATIVWTTHNLFQARRVAQRIAFLLSGELIELSPVESFFASPADARTAAFVRGEMVY